MGLRRWFSSLLRRRSGKAGGDVVPLPAARVAGGPARAQSGPRLVAHPLAVGERGPMAAALAKAQLPADDVDDPGRLFWRFDTIDDMPVGFGGIEICGDAALLRSIMTLPPVRTRGIGGAIVQALEAEAALQGCRHCYLLTMSGPGFFERLGYARCDPAAVPKGIRDTRLFAARAASVIVMAKRL